MSGNESRLQAIYQITNRETAVSDKTDPLGEIWACDVFNLATMEDSLSKNAYNPLHHETSQ